MRTIFRWTAAIATLLPSLAFAGGYDTPILYSARHMGMGGTGVSWVSDPTAMFMNPAGVGHVEFIDVHLNLSPIFATLDAVPEKDTQVKAGPVLLTPFLVGADFRAWKYVSFGIGAYPIAASSGAYDYTSLNSKKAVKDETSVRFIEISPVIAFNYKDIVSLGIGYRVTLAELNRQKKVDGAAGSYFDFDTKGWNFEGFRIGAQYKPWKFLSLGVNYRHKIETVAKADSGQFLSVYNIRNIEFPLVLPSRLSFGARVDTELPQGSLGISLDSEYCWQSQNKQSHVTFEAQPIAAPTAPWVETPLESYYRWKDAWTIRAGAEYTIDQPSLGGTWAARLGFVWDQETSNRNYSSAFGTPPADTFSYTLGGGYRAKHWEVNLAYAYRNGGTTIVEEDTTKPNREDTCLTCSFPGNHEITLHGIYADFTWYFDLPGSLADWSPTAADAE